jgi:hypothetical protein
VHGVLVARCGRRRTHLVRPLELADTELLLPTTPRPVVATRGRQRLDSSGEFALVVVRRSPSVGAGRGLAARGARGVLRDR